MNFIIKKRNYNIYFLILHILFTLITILLTLVSLLNDDGNLRKLVITIFNIQQIIPTSTLRSKYKEIVINLNLISILFALATCLIILIYELIIITKFRKYFIKNLTKCVICSCYFLSSKFFFFFVKNNFFCTIINFYLFFLKLYSIYS